MKVMEVLRRWIGREKHDHVCADDECRRERLEEADRRLHEQARRLHVLEWEAYGHRRTPRHREH